MTTTELSKKRAIDLTGEELAEIILQKISPEIIRPRRILRGIKGIMEALNVGKSKAEEIRKQGIIDSAISEDGKLFFVDADLALDVYHEYRQKINKGFQL